MMHDITDQIDEAWTDHVTSHRNGQTAGLDTSETAERQDKTRSIVTARDFMIMRIPAHELSPEEAEEIRRAKVEGDRVTEEWAERGGVWVDGSETAGASLDGQGRWVGYGPQPDSAGSSC